MLKIHTCMKIALSDMKALQQEESSQARWTKVKLEKNKKGSINCMVALICSHREQLPQGLSQEDQDCLGVQGQPGHQSKPCTLLSKRMPKSWWEVGEQLQQTPQCSSVANLIQLIARQKRLLFQQATEEVGRAGRKAKVQERQESQMQKPQEEVQTDIPGSFGERQKQVLAGEPRLTWNQRSLCPRPLSVTVLSNHVPPYPASPIIFNVKARHQTKVITQTLGTHQVNTSWDPGFQTAF